MQALTRTIAFTRSLMLKREHRKVRAEFEALSLLMKRKLAAATFKEVALAEKHECPHFYYTRDNRYHLWGSGTKLALERMRSENPQLQLRGLALWITVAFFETQNSPYQEIKAIHRSLVKTMRELKAHVPEWKDKTALKAA